MAVPGPVAADAWAVRDVVRWGAILGPCQEVVRDCPLAPKALDRDFLWVMAERALPVLPHRRGVQERPQARQLQDDCRRVVCRTGLPAARAPRAVPPLALLALQPGPDESELVLAQPRRAQAVSRPAAVLQEAAWELEPGVEAEGAPSPVPGA